MHRWTDDDGNEAVIYNGHLTIYGTPGMCRDDGVVAIGIDLPDWLAAAIRNAEAYNVD